MLSHKDDIFFIRLKDKNILFFIALHFCKPHYRPLISALIGLYFEWTGLFNRIKEPLAIQMRLTWWHEQFKTLSTLQNSLPEIALLKDYPICELLNAIENEYLHQDKSYHGQSGYILFKLIAEIMNYHRYADNAGAYGLFYAIHHEKTDTPTTYPKSKLPFGLRFLRIPIILEKKQNFFKLIYDLIKNYML